MHSFTTLLTTGALASVALALPQYGYGSSSGAGSQTKKGFSVTGSVAKPLPAFPVRMANAYKKYGAPVPDHLAAAAAGTGSAVTTPEASDVAYLTPVNIGGQTLNLDFDTGSADL